MKSKYWFRMHKYGIKIPESVNKAYKTDTENINIYWRDAINQEMEKVRVVLKERKLATDKISVFQ